MTTRTTLAGVIAAAVTLTACDASAQPVATTPTVAQACVTWHDDTPAVPGDEYAVLVDDDVCEDAEDDGALGVLAATGVAWHYGGSSYARGGRTYVRGGSRARPVNTLIKVRAPEKGGSYRTQGAALSHNEGVRRATVVDQPANPAKVDPTKASTAKNAPARSGDDRRQSFGSSNSSSRSGTGRR
jgi:hypothetical protein